MRPTLPPTGVAKRSEPLSNISKITTEMKNTQHTHCNHLFQRLVKERNLVDKFIEIAKELHYPIFKSNDSYPINLNIWGIRSNNKCTTHYNDVIAVFYNEVIDDGDVWNLHLFEATTDPSDLLLEQPVNDAGTAILAEGYHKSLWEIGKHKAQYIALVQANPCYIYRDNNEDVIMDLDTLSYGEFGINLHHAANTKVQEEIGHYSAGCQVIKDIHQWNDVFIPLVKKAVGKGTQSYILINEMDLY